MRYPVCLIVLALAFVGSANAVTLSKTSPGGSTGTISVFFNAATNSFAWNVTISNGGGEGCGVDFYRTVSNGGAQTGPDLVYKNQNGTYSGTVTGATAGAWYALSFNYNGYSGGWNNPLYTIWFQAEQAYYKVTFAVPANNTDRLVRYEVWQDGAFTGQSTSQGPGDPAREWTAHGLTSPNSATLREVRVNLVQGTDGMWYAGASSLVRVVNGGTSPLPDAGSTSGGTGSPGTVSGPTQVVVGQPAPPPSNTSSGGNKVVNVWNSQSGAAPTGGSTQAVTDSLYKEGVDKITQAVTAGAGSVVDAVNGLAENGTAIQGKLDDVKASVDAVKTAVENGMAAVAEAVGEGSNSGDGDDEEGVGAASTAIGDAVAGAGAKINATKGEASDVYSGLLDGRGVSAPTVSTSGSTSQVVEWVGPDWSPSGVPAEVDLNPVNSDLVPEFLKQLVAWFRAFVGWATVLGFFAYCIREIRLAIGVVFITQTQQHFGPQIAATAIPVAGAAISITARVTIMAVLAAACVAMPAALIQVFSTEWSTLLSTFAETMTNAGGSGGGGEFASVFAIANQFVPVATLLAVMLSYSAFELAILPVQGIWQWTLRFLPL